MIPTIAAFVWIGFLFVFKPSVKLSFGTPLSLALITMISLLTRHQGVALDVVITVYFLLFISLCFNLLFYEKHTN